MNHFRFFLVLVCVCGICHAGEPPQILRNESFDKLSIRQAGVSARKIAVENFQAGNLCVLYFTKEIAFGKGIFNYGPDEYLLKKYGVECRFNPIDQTDPMLNAVDVYNETMVKLIIKHFGSDIFQEALQNAKR